VLMSELIARGKGKRILVVALKSMMLQLQKELWTGSPFRSNGWTPEGSNVFAPTFRRTITHFTISIR